MRRIRGFEEWLQSTSYERVVIVGHSQLFKRMTRAKEYMRNCDVLELRYEMDMLTGEYRWSEPCRSYRTALSKGHPLNRFFDADFDAYEDEDAHDRLGESKMPSPTGTDRSLVESLLSPFVIGVALVAAMFSVLMSVWNHLIS